MLRGLTLAVAVSIAFSIAGFLAPSDARAQSAGNAALAQKYAELAKEFYQRQQYREAITHYLKAFELVQDAKYIYNVAQAHRLDGNREKALWYYEQYLKLAPQGRGVKTASRHAAELRAAIEAEKKAEAEAREREKEAERRAQKEAERRRRLDELVKKRLAEKKRRQVRERQRREALKPPLIGWSGAVATALDYKARGVAVQVAGGMTLGKRVELRAGGILGPTFGAYLGGVVYPVRLGKNGTWRPLVGAGLPMFFSDGLRYGLRIGTGVEWQLHPRISLAADLGLEHMFNPQWNREATALVPLLGLRATP